MIIGCLFPSLTYLVFADVHSEVYIGIYAALALLASMVSKRKRI
jgi:hypothetical protein